MRPYNIICFVIANLFLLIGIALLAYAVTNYNPWLNMLSLIGGIASLGSCYITLMHIIGDQS